MVNHARKPEPRYSLVYNVESNRIYVGSEAFEEEMATYNPSGKN